MLFRLAALLGRTVDELKESLSENEFLHWCKYYEIEPWGCEAEDVRSALQTSYFVSTQVKNPSNIQPKRFLPKWGKTSREPSWKAHKATMKNAIQAFKVAQESKCVPGDRQSVNQGNG